MPELRESAINLLFDIVSDHNGLESPLVQIGADVKQRLTPIHGDASKSLSIYMVHRGRVADGILKVFFEALLTRFNRCHPVATTQGRCKRDDNAATLSQNRRLPLG